MNKIIKELKENNEDFEFYPTTNEILNVIKKDINCESSYSFLDIGCGDGKAYDYLKQDVKINKYLGIEKSNVLINKLHKDVIVVGNDFNSTTLYDKEVDIIFCNPTLTDLFNWVNRIIQECYFTDCIYLVIPKRWENNDSIISNIDDKNLEFKVLGNFDFLNSEDREARAKIHIVKLSYKNKYDKKDSPFTSFLKTKLKVKDQQHGCDEYTYYNSIKNKLNNTFKNKDLIKSDDYINNIVQLYNNEYDHLQKQLNTLIELDNDLLTTIGTDLENVSEIMFSKLTVLKRIYWNELFNNLQNITTRLTLNSRSLLEKSLTNENIDFINENIRNTVIWVIKNYKTYINDQLLSLYKTLTNEKNITLYKSNEKYKTDLWQYLRTDINKFKYRYFLDYRLVLHGLSLTKAWSLGCKFLSDLIPVINSLGFVFNKTPLYNDILNINNTDYLYNTWYDITGFIDNKKVILFQFKTFKNDNLHIRFHKDVMASVNIEVGKILNWLNDKSDIKKENIQNINDNQVEKYFDNNASTLLIKTLKNKLLS